MISMYRLNKTQWLRIALIIDQDFRDSMDTFSSTREKGYYILDSNRCDYASIIKVHTNDDFELTHITRVGDDTDGWQEIRPETMLRVIDYLKTQE